MKNFVLSLVAVFSFLFLSPSYALADSFSYSPSSMSLLDTEVNMVTVSISCSVLTDTFNVYDPDGLMLFNDTCDYYLDGGVEDYANFTYNQVGFATEGNYKLLQFSEEITSVDYATDSTSEFLITDYGTVMTIGDGSIISPVMYDSFTSFASSATGQVASVVGIGLGLLIVFSVTRWIIKLFKGETGLNNAPTQSTPQYFGGVGHRYSGTNR